MFQRGRRPLWQQVLFFILVPNNGLRVLLLVVGRECSGPPNGPACGAGCEAASATFGSDVRARGSNFDLRSFHKVILTGKRSLPRLQSAAFRLDERDGPQL